MSLGIQTPHNGRPKHYQLGVRQRQGNNLEIWCKLLGPLARFDPQCRRLNDGDKPSGGSPSQPGNQAPAAPSATSRQPQQPTTNNPPPITTGPPPPQTAAPTPPPVQTSGTTSAASPPSSAAGTPQPDSEQPGPSQTNSSPQVVASSLDILTGTSLALSMSEAPSRASSLVQGTPTQSTFTSVIVTLSGGEELTITSTGVTLVTPRVPAPTDLDGRYDPPESVGASSKSTNIGAIVGGVLGVLALLVICALAFLLYQRRKRKRTAPSSEFLRRYGHTTLNTPRDSDSCHASNLEVSQMRQAQDDTLNAYNNSSPYAGGKR